ncbi:hypothetical protein M378DRAFT_11828 [Amanita muscaria Koide BX008]|uniref:Uncharacterized protein n=1 Tax=Amanita muscaria (strain Koide BX008) TaxID=946122 RepID=A0A0C2SL09_AMAMK|nr:hypothetical protein M378DRAFT_11828 [Amanita muscaria Koide BX008]
MCDHPGPGPGLDQDCRFSSSVLGPDHGSEPNFGIPTMRYFGGGVGHASTREATDFFLLDRHQEELEDRERIEDIAEDSDSDSGNVPTASATIDEPEVEEDYGYNELSEDESEDERDDEINVDGEAEGVDDVEDEYPEL